MNRGAVANALGQQIQELFDQQQQTQAQLQQIQQHQNAIQQQQQQFQAQLQQFQAQQQQFQQQFQAQLQQFQAQQQQFQAQQQQFQQQFQAQQQQFQAQLQQMQNAIAQQNVANVPHLNEMRRHSNRIAKNQQPLVPILDNAGQVPNHFPQDKSAMAVFSAQQLNALIAYYGLNGHGLSKQAKLNLLADYFGF
jgi:chromosome segregation ATPase